MFEFIAYATLLIGLPILVPLWIAYKIYRHTKRSSNHVVFATFSAATLATVSFVVLGYTGFLGSIYLACDWNKNDPECEYIAWDTLFATK